MRKLIDIVLDCLFVPRCAVCRERLHISEGGLCEDCRRAYDRARAEYCDVCGMEASVCRCVPQNLSVNGCVAYRKLVFYKPSAEISVVRGMMYALKRNHAAGLSAFLAAELAELVKETVSEDTVVTFAPRAASAKQKYGYDQGELLAKHVAADLGLDFRRLLTRRRFQNREQKFLNAAERQKNVRDLFFVRKPRLAADKRILLIDDVVTSGATLGACAGALYRAGAREVRCLSVAYTVRRKNNKSKKD